MKTEGKIKKKQDTAKNLESYFVACTPPDPIASKKQEGNNFKIRW